MPRRRGGHRRRCSVGFNCQGPGGQPARHGVVFQNIMGRMALNFWSTPAHAILMMLAGWIHREQEAVVAYQKEEIRAL